MIRVTNGMAIAESEVTYRFFVSSGPGGQNVNKVATAAQLRFDAASSPSLAEEVVRRLRSIAGRRMTADGVVHITAQRFRSQDRNREDALDRLVALLRRAAERPNVRRATRPPKGAVERRLESKSRRSATKRTRGTVRDTDD
jgi:ribosome-associated protein